MQAIETLIEKVVPEIRALRRDIHRHPEPSFEERATAGKVVEKLKRIAGLDIQPGVAGTGIVATLGAEKNGKCIALRADMDCLRMQEENTFSHASAKAGLMHACGHDGHTACLVGAALVLGQIQEEIAGPVKFIFQPAEENLGGAQGMVAAGVLAEPKVEAIFGLHGTTALALGEVGLRSGPAMAASRYFTITVKGRGCHAASPHKGIDPVLIASQIICAAQAIVARNVDPLEAGLISIPKFTGSTAANVIPEQAVLQGTLRALTNAARDLLQRRLQEVTEYTALAHGGSAEIEYHGGYPLLENDPDSIAYVRDVAAALLPGEKIHIGYPAMLGAEDFAFYLEQVPGAFFWLGLQPEGAVVPSLHHPRFDFNDDVIPLAIRLHCDIVRNFHTR